MKYGQSIVAHANIEQTRKQCIQCARKARFGTEETGGFHKITFEEVICLFGYIQTDLTGRHTLSDVCAHALVITCI